MAAKSVPICVGPELYYVFLQPSSMKDGADSEQEELPQTQEVKLLTCHHIRKSSCVWVPARTPACLQVKYRLHDQCYVGLLLP